MHLGALSEHVQCNYDFHNTSTVLWVKYNVITVFEVIIILFSILLTLSMMTSWISGLSTSLSGCMKRQLTVSLCQQHGHNKKKEVPYIITNFFLPYCSSTQMLNFKNDPQHHICTWVIYIQAGEIFVAMEILKSCLSFLISNWVCCINSELTN